MAYDKKSYQREYYKKNRDKMLEYYKNKYKNNKESMLKENKEYRELNKDSIKQKRDLYRKENPKKVREASRKCYQKNRQTMLIRMKINNKKLRESRNDWWEKYKSNISCKICGESSPECLDHHHIDPSLKDTSPYRLIYYSMKKLKDEISKCVVLCANCHRKEHRRLKEEAE